MARACLEKAFCKMCVTICGRFCPDEGVVAGYDNRIRAKSPAKWGVQIAGMLFQTRSRVYFVREEISIEVPVGISVLEAEIRAGLAPDAPCGGQGTCGKCRVKVDGKPVLACQTKVEKDCQVEIPGKKKRGKILSEGFFRKVNFQPELQVKTVWLEKPETGEKSQSGK